MAKNRILTLLGFLTFLFLVSALNNTLTTSNNNPNNNQVANNHNDNITEKEEEINLKPSNSWLLPYLYIKNNWSEAKSKGLCSGFGLPWIPYVIENITIDASNSPYGSGIYILDSNNAFFTIRNCTIYNQRNDGSIETSPRAGIFLFNSSFGTLENNTIYNSDCGISLFGGNYTQITNNNIKDCDLGIMVNGLPEPYGIRTYNCSMIGNNMTNCGIDVFGSIQQLLSHNITTSNLANQKPIYYYVNEKNLDSSNFTKVGQPGQILLYYCNHSILTNLDVSRGSMGFLLSNCVNITINYCNLTSNYNGITLSNCANVSVVFSRLINNKNIGIKLKDPDFCNISQNYFECDSTAIWMEGGESNEIKTNTMVRCGIFFSTFQIPSSSNIIDTSNTVNSKRLYYYRDANKLRGDDFKIPGQVILINCNDSIISDLNLSRGSYGILVYNSQNVTISHNNVSFCKETGIFAYTSNNITISKNNADYCKNGIEFDTGEDVNFTDNSIIYNNETGLQLLRVDYTQILNNTLSNNGKEGLKVEVSNYSNITKSVITNNALDGIVLHCDYYFNVENNTVDANKDGITLSQTHFSTITRNKILNNVRYGAYIDDSDAGSCDIYNNSFINNGVKNAYDIYGNNNWYKGTLGNFWHDYPGKDANDNGIGDTAYIINSVPSIRDLYPIFWDAPIFTFLTPIPNKEYGKDSPIFSIIIFEGKNDTTWYTLGNNPTKYNFTGTFGKINQTGWDAFGNGSLIIHFCVNDSRGCISSMTDPVLKDIFAPEIAINAPIESKIYNSTAPYFDVLITEPYLSKAWYRLWNGTHWSINFTISGTGSHRTDQIDQDAWNDCPNGTLTIQFFANDTVKNLGSSPITIRKDIIGPIIVITKPLSGDLFNATAPDESCFDVSFSEGNGIDSYWYVLVNGTNGADFTGKYPWNGKIDQEVWDEMDNGSVIIRIFANDSLGNVGSSEVLVRKDIVSLYLKILTPVNGTLLGIASPDFSLSIGGSNLDTLWYMLINATNTADFTNNFTFSESPTTGLVFGTIDPTFWNEMDNGSVVIRFFLNNTFGQTIWKGVVVRKDAIKPNITIVLPELNKDGSGTAPAFVVIIVEMNNDTYWYRLYNGYQYSTPFIFTSNGTINQTAWSAMWSFQKNIMIFFYCNDTAGNVGSANVTVIHPSARPMAWIPPVSDDDDDNGEQEGFDFVKFITSPVGMGVVGGSAAGGVATAIFLKKRVSAKKKLKEVKRIKDLRKNL